MTESNPVINVFITDEFEITYKLEFDNYKDFNKELKKWLKANETGSTPLYTIKIDFLG